SRRPTLRDASLRSAPQGEGGGRRTAAPQNEGGTSASSSHWRVRAPFLLHDTGGRRGGSSPPHPQCGPKPPLEGRGRPHSRDFAMATPSVLRDDHAGDEPAHEADIVAVLPVHAGDARLLAVDGAIARRDGVTKVLVFRRPRDDAAGIVGDDAD